jgi:hypothetical protein
MNYTIQHLKVAHYAGTENMPFGEVAELFALLERNKLLHLLADDEPGMGKKAPRSRLGYKVGKTKRGKGSRRGKLSANIVSFLQSKGPKGAHVKEIAEAINAPAPSVNVWFYGTGKKYLKSKEIKKVARATFAYFKPGNATS